VAIEAPGASKFLSKAKSATGSAAFAAATAWQASPLAAALFSPMEAPCQPGDTGCQVDVLDTQLEEVVE